MRENNIEKINNRQKNQKQKYQIFISFGQIFHLTITVILFIILIQKFL